MSKPSLDELLLGMVVLKNEWGYGFCPKSLDATKTAIKKLLVELVPETYEDTLDLNPQYANGWYYCRQEMLKRISEL